MAGLSDAELAAQVGHAGFDPSKMDRNRGAPIKVRAAVGAAHSAKDKLLTLRQWYPDAVSYGDDNFVFTDPETGQPTLYNEEGTSVFGLFNAPSMGDVAGAGIDIATGLGGTLGAAGGAVAGGGVGSVPLAAAGGAAGSTAAEQGYDWFAEKYLGTVDTRSTGEKAADAALTAGLGIFSEVGGAALGQGIKATAKAAKPALQNLDVFGRLGIKPTPAMVADSAGVRGAEAALEALPFSKGTITRAQEKATERLGEKVQETAQGFGGPVVPGPEDAGAMLKKGAEEAGERYRVERNTMDDKLTAMIGADRAAPIKAIGDAWQGMTRELERAPELLQGSLGAARTRLGNAITVAARDSGVDVAKLGADPKEWPPEVLAKVLDSGTVPYDILRRARTSLGEVLDAPDAGGLRAEGQAALNKAYGAIKDDISAAADAVSPEAGKLQRELDAFTREFRGGDKASVAEALTRVTKAKSSLEAWNMVRGLTGDAEQFQRIAQRLTPAERDKLAGAIIGDLGTAGPGAVERFSPDTYLTNWNRMAKGTKDMLFNQRPELRRALDDLERATTLMKKSKTFRNRSNTGNAVSWGQLLTVGSGGGIGSQVAGATLGGPGGAVAAAAVPYVLAQAWRSPAFVKALAKFSSTPWWDMPAEAARNRLARTLATQSWAGDPAEAYVHQFMESMREPPQKKAQ